MQLFTLESTAIRQRNALRLTESLRFQVILPLLATQNKPCSYNTPLKMLDARQKWLPGILGPTRYLTLAGREAGCEAATLQRCSDNSVMFQPQRLLGTIASVIHYEREGNSSSHTYKHKRVFSWDRPDQSPCSILHPTTKHIYVVPNPVLSPAATAPPKAVLSFIVVTTTVVLVAKIGKLESFQLATSTIITTKKEYNQTPQVRAWIRRVLLTIKPTTTGTYSKTIRLIV